MTRHDYEQYAQDSAILGEIGRILFPQDTQLSVRLPKDLADQALAAWRRDEPGAARTAQETPEQQLVRTRAAYLALIGLCIENTALPSGGEVLCELDALYIASALQAAEEQGLLIH